MSGSPFKERYNNHMKSFNLACHGKETEPSKHVWSLKRNGRDVSIRWYIRTRSNHVGVLTPPCNASTNPFSHSNYEGLSDKFLERVVLACSKMPLTKKMHTNWEVYLTILCNCSLEKSPLMQTFFGVFSTFDFERPTHLPYDCFRWSELAIVICQCQLGGSTHTFLVDQKLLQDVVVFRPICNSYLWRYSKGESGFVFKILQNFADLLWFLPQVSFIHYVSV